MITQYPGKTIQSKQLFFLLLKCRHMLQMIRKYKTTTPVQTVWRVYVKVYKERSIWKYEDSNSFCHL